MSRMSPDTKKMVFESCIFMKILYYAKFSSWRLEDYRDLDRKVSRFYRMISKNMAPFAEDLLYFPVKEGGLGFKRLSDMVQMSKLTLMGRLITVGGPAGKAMEALLMRGFRSAGQFFPPGSRATMAKSLGQCSWVTSLADWLAEIGIGLNRPGSPEPAGNPSILSLLGEADVERREWASCRGVGCLAEIHMEDDVGELIPGLEWVADHPPAPKACIPIRVGQVWFLPTEWVGYMRS